MSTIAGLAAAGLVIFLVGVVVGALDQLPSPAVIAGIVVVVIVVIVAITWMVRMRKP